MISTEKCCFDNWENFPNSNLCVRQNNSGISSSVFFAQPTFVHVQRVQNFFAQKFFVPS